MSIFIYFGFEEQHILEREVMDSLKFEVLFLVLSEFRQADRAISISIISDLQLKKVGDHCSIALRTRAGPTQCGTIGKTLWPPSPMLYSQKKSRE